MSGSLQVCGRLCEGGEVVTVRLEGGRIAGLQAGAACGALGSPDAWLAPGFCDLQLNGYAGHDFNAGTWAATGEVSGEAAPIFACAARSGTALACPTITTNSRERMLARLAALARALDTDSHLERAVPGIHVEGPFLSPEDGPRGAHPREHVRPPDWDEFQAMQEAAGDRIRLFTLAPEVPGALDLIERLAAAGIVVCLGHTGASPATIRDAVRAGARVTTHFGNGAHAVLPRHPNYLWEQLAEDRLFATVIADGYHLPDSVLKCAARVKGPDRLALVSDAVSLGGLAAGIYAEGRHEVLASGQIVVCGTPYLAGAGHLLDWGVGNALRATGFSLAEVVRTVTAVPARILGLEHRKGHLRVGYDGDVTLFRVPAAGPLDVLLTVRAGEVVHRAAGVGSITERETEWPT